MQLQMVIIREEDVTEIMSPLSYPWIWILYTGLHCISCPLWACK